MINKSVLFDVALKSAERKPRTYVNRQQVMTNDKNSIELLFRATDTTPSELTGSTAIVYLYMQDGSFFQKTNADVARENNMFSYVLTANEAKHKGIAKTQIVIKVGTTENASPLFEFEILGGLETKPIVEREIQDWTTLTAEAKAFVDEIKDKTVDQFVELKMGEELANLEANYATRLTGLESNDASLAAQLAQTNANKVDKDGSMQVKWANIAQDARENISGGQTAVVDKDSVGEENIINKSVSLPKLDDALKSAVVSNFTNMWQNANADFSIESTGVSGRLHIALSGKIHRFSSYSASYQTVDLVAGKKYYTHFKIGAQSTATLQQFVIILYADGTSQTIGSAASAINDRVTQVFTANKTSKANVVFVTADAGTIYRDNQVLVDLTKLYGAGNEPNANDFYLALSTFKDNWVDRVNYLSKITENLIDKEADRVKEVIRIDADILNGDLSNFKNLWRLSGIENQIESTGRSNYIHINNSGQLVRFSSYFENYQAVNLVAGRKYYTHFKAKSSSAVNVQNHVIVLYEDGTRQTLGNSSDASGKLVTEVFTANKTAKANVVFLTSGAGLLIRDNQLLVDLTSLYGAGNEPDLDGFKNVLSAIPSGWFDTSIKTRDLLTYALAGASGTSGGSAPSQPVLPSSVFSVFAKIPSRRFRWYDTDRKILYATYNNNTLQKSTDRGATWQSVFTAGSTIMHVYTLISGAHLVHLTSGDLMRVTADWQNSQIVESGVTGVLNSSLSIADNGTTILWGEYGWESGDQYRILKSTDDGMTWEVSHDGSDIRHWHSVQLDPYTGEFWACAGDREVENRILKSSDSGDTWQVMTQGGQQSRAVGLVFFKDYIMWAMDSTVNPKVIRASRSDFSQTVVGDSPNSNPVLGVSKTIDGKMLGWTRVEQNSVNRENCHIFVSDGETVEVVSQFAIKEEIVGTTSSDGFYICSELDDENKMYLWPSGLKLGDGTFGFSVPI